MANEADKANAPTQPPGAGQRVYYAYRLASVLQIAGGAMTCTLLLAAAQAANLLAHLPFVVTGAETQLMPMLWLAAVPVGLLLIRTCAIYPEARVRPYAGVLAAPLTLLLLTADSVDILAYEYVGPLAVVPGSFVFAHGLLLVLVFWTPQHVLWPSMARRERLVGIGTSAALLVLVVMWGLGEPLGWAERGAGVAWSVAAMVVFLAWYGWRHDRATPGMMVAAVAAMTAAAGVVALDLVTGLDLVAVALLVTHVMAARPSLLMVRAFRREKQAELGGVDPA